MGDPRPGLLERHVPGLERMGLGNLRPVYNHRLSPMGAVATGDLAGAIVEIRRVAKLGFRGLTFPCKPVWGGHDAAHANYNLPEFDPLWQAVQEVDLPITFHVSTGRDPRASRGNGGAVINYAVHSLAPTMEPLANLCASGVLERFPKLRFATIEAGIGWVPWALQAMDEAYTKHHMWVRPKLRRLPSEYFREHGFASFQEDPAGPGARTSTRACPLVSVGERLPAPRRHVAPLGPGDRAPDVCSHGR